MKKLRIEFNVRIPMRDGVELSADIYFPPSYLNGKQFPTILLRTPYLKTDLKYVEEAKYFAFNDYVYIFQDVRGRGDSDGAFRPFFNEREDGYDTIEWIAKQPWCTGKIGMLGGSYMGYVQWAAARDKPPHLTTMISTAPGGKFMEELPYFNGIPHLYMLNWLESVQGHTNQTHSTKVIDWNAVFHYIPLKTLDSQLCRNMETWQEWMSHPTLDDYWKEIRLTKDDFQRINIPVLHITGWYDGDQPGAMFFYRGMINYSSAAKKQCIIAGPWSHKGTRYPTRKLWGVEFTEKAVLDIYQIHLDWFDYYLKEKQNGVDSWHRSKYFVMGENEWHTTQEYWPVKEARTKIFLHSGGKANSSDGDGRIDEQPLMEEPFDEYIYDPEEATRKYLESQKKIPAEESMPNQPKYIMKKVEPEQEPSEEEGSMDINPYLKSPNVLVYTSDEFKKPLTITGNPYIEFYASTDCLDTDWFVALMDMTPDGKSIYITNRLFGMQRARYRNSLERAELLEPNKIYKYWIDLAHLSISLLPGHRLRLGILSSGFPEWARNHNTGNDIPSDIEFKVATNRIYHDREHPAILYLPI